MDSTIIEQLKRIERRMRYQRAIVYSSLGLATGLALAIVLTIACRFVPVLTLYQQITADAIIIALAILAPVCVALFRSQKLVQVARVADRRADLKERLSTAVELAEAGASSFLAAKQRQDAERAASTLNPKQVIPFSLSKVRLLVALGLVVILAGLTVLPNPMHAVLEDRAANAKTIKEEKAKIEQVKKELLESSQNAASEKQQELMQDLDQLLKDLSSPSLSKEDALAKVSSAEEKLAKMTDKNLAAERLGLNQLARGLQNLAKIDPSLQEGASSNPDKLSEDLSQLAQKLDEMSPSEKADIADALSSTAGALSSSNPRLATQLAKASDALMAGDASAAEDALDKAEGELQEMDQRLADQKATEKALSQLQASRGAIARSGSSQGSSFVRSNQGAAGAQGSQAGSQSGNNGQGTGNQSSSGSGNSGSPGAGTGSPSGSGTVAGSTANTSPGANSSGTGQPATGRQGTTGTGNYEPVYTPGGLNSEGKPLFLPGAPDSGESESKWLNTPPSGEGKSVVPYSEVFDSYSEAAARSLDSSYIPINLKEYIRGYFTSIEPAAKE